MPTSLFAAPLGVPSYRAYDANGDPLAGGQLETYVAGTVTPLATYPTYADALSGVNSNSNPVILDANGSAQVWVQTGFYKFILRNSTGTLQYSQDYVAVANGFPSPSLDAWVPELNTGTMQYIGATSFRVGPGDFTSIYTAQRRVRTTNTGGTRYGTVVSSVFGGGSTTVTIINDSGTLDAGLSAVYYGIEPYVSPAYLSPRSALCMLKTGNQTGFGAMTKIQNWTTDVDNLTEWDNVNNRWVAKYPGNYLVTLQTELSDTGVSQVFGLNLFKNGVSVRSCAGRTLATANYLSTPSLQTVIAMTAAQYLEAHLIGTANTTVFGTTGTIFSVQRIP